MESPILKAMESLELDRNELAALSGVAGTTIEYTEKGIFTSIPAGVRDILQEWDPDIELNYRKYQIAKRFLWEGVKDLPQGFPYLSDMMHPHTEWRMNIAELNVNQYCEALCVPRFVVQKYEAGEQAKFPEILTVALTMACGSTLASELAKICKEWLTSVR